MNPETIDAMLAAGVTADVLAAAWKADIAAQQRALTERRSKDAERQRRHRESRDVTVTNAVSRDPAPNERDNLTPTREEKTEAKASSKNMGSRLPDDWEARPLTGKTLEMVTAWPAGMIEREMAKFKDHWLKTPGARGRSLDWDASYRNWLRNAEERRPRQYERSKQASLSSVVNRLLGDGATDCRASEDAGPSGANVDERGTARALAARGC